jgi:protein-disulfide isomerase
MIALCFDAWMEAAVNCLNLVDGGCYVAMWTFLRKLPQRSSPHQSHPQDMSKAKQNIQQPQYPLLQCCRRTRLQPTTSLSLLLPFKS